MLAFVQLSYNWAAPFEVMPPADWAAVSPTLDGIFPQLSIRELDEPTEKADGALKYRSISGGYETMIDLAEDGPILSAYGIEYTVKRFKGARIVGGTAVKYEGANVINNTTTVQIAIADLGLLNIRNVQVLEDACTNSLQQALNEGWRILAVCPPVAQRRPDYVMGHSG